jgi:hypothetical protein
MNEKSMEMVFNYLDGIASRLGTTVEHVWPWLVRQQYINAIYPVFIAIIAGCIFFAITIYTNKHWDTEYGFNISKRDLEAPFISACVLSGAVFLFYLIVSMFSFSHVFNPEYHALMKLISMVK